jgi:gas vesicle protein
MARDHGDGFLAGFILGTFAGAVLALLFAPAPGEETRERLRERGIELRGEAEHLAQRSRELLEERMARLEEAVEEGRRAAEQTRQELRAKLESQMETPESPDA